MLAYLYNCVLFQTSRAQRVLSFMAWIISKSMTFCWRSTMTCPTSALTNTDTWPTVSSSQVTPHHYNDVTCTSWCLKPLATRLFAQAYVHAYNKESSKHYWFFVRGIHRWPVDSSHKDQVIRKAFTSCHAVIIQCWCQLKFYQINTRTVIIVDEISFDIGAWYFCESSLPSPSTCYVYGIAR